MHNKVTFVQVKTNFSGIHNWATCPIEEVAFLKAPHRHMFYITLQVSVEHNDRDLEFFVLKRELNDIIKALYGDAVIKDLGSKSCEMINGEIFEKLMEKYPTKSFIIETSEDGESSAVSQFIYESPIAPATMTYIQKG